ncbi:MAG: hypothetical protein LBQ15_12795 [Clostridium sp.]|jgi:hypothetical protein|nr:hypothetical protein [Clostridium sp.]
MTNFYEEIYSYYEENSELHPGIAKVDKAEREAAALLSTITDKEQREAIDTLIGKIARAYEMQGFLFARNVCGSGAAVYVVCIKPRRGKFGGFIFCQWRGK